MKKDKNILEKDLKIWEDYTKNPTDIFDKDFKENKKNKTRFRFDLHGFSLNDANKKVKEIILSCSQKNYKEVLLITGKGLHSNTESNLYVSKNLSKLRYSIPNFINNDMELSDLIISIELADKINGGSGALIIKLKNIIR